MRPSQNRTLTFKSLFRGALALGLGYAFGAFLASVLSDPARAQEAEKPAEGGITLENCRIRGLSVPARCGTFSVFEDREAASGRQIDLRVVVIPAQASRPEPDPVFVLAGGPGQAASELAAAVGNRLDKIRERRDIVLVDQRGTGESNGLQCSFAEDEDIERALSTDLMERELVTECRDSFADTDLTKYTTSIAMDDLDDVRAALGYETINVYGGSYGTRAGLVYLRRHEEHVRTALLDGVAPPGMNLPLPMGRDAQRALELLFEDCAASTECSERFGDLESTWGELVNRLESGPIDAEVLHPRTGERLQIPISAEVFGSTIRGALYSPDLSSLIPLTVERAAAGDFQTLITLAQPLSSAPMYFGMFLSVVCAEDVPRIDRTEIDEAASASILGRASVRTITNACTVWPQADVPETYYEPVQSAKPVLVLSGRLDPVTPPAWGDSILDGLSESTHLVAPGAGHGVAFRTCMADVTTAFIESGTAEGLDSSCVETLERPPFFLTAAGTSP
ncbi:MAG: alpha/beta hydrolase [Acidobacteriota bacterium]